MKAKEGVLDRLNGILTNDLTAINQYFLQSEMCQQWGYERLYHKLREISFEEMKDAQRLIRHILYLEGVPNLQRLGAVRVGENVLQHLQLDLELEQGMVEALTEAISHSAQMGDYTTRSILEDMVKGEEDDIDWLETQLEAIRQVGLESYLSQQLYGD